MTMQTLYHKATKQILQWQDTEKLNYVPPLPTQSLHEVTQEEWDNQELFTHVVDGELTDVAPTVTQQEIMLVEYASFRQREYPNPLVMIDALVKKGSDDPDLQAEGELQYQKYVEDCLAVKAKYPKPE